MLSNTHYYHRIMRKMVVSFGSIFNNLKLIRYDNEGITEIERINVPIVYSNKEKFYIRTTEDPELARQVQMVFPRMAFEMTGVTYDPLRKISSNIDNFTNSPPNSLKKVKATPYNFDFNLYIAVRNVEDGMQMVEQILPYFNPDYTVTLDLVNLNNLKLDVPIVFNSITNEVSAEGTPEETRTIGWNLNFTMKGYLFGAISDGKIIRKVTANVYNYNYETTNKGLYFSSGTGDFKTGELVYQGTTLTEAVAKAFVKSWDTRANSLILYDVTGTFVPNTYITGAVSGATYNVSTFSTNPTQMVNITITPDPPTANANDDFGFTTTIEEFPNII